MPSELSVKYHQVYAIRILRQERRNLRKEDQRATDLQPDPRQTEPELSLAKSTIAEDINFVKNAVNNAGQPSTQALSGAESVKSGGPPTQAPVPVSLAPSASSKERDTVKLESLESASLLHQKTPEELGRKINDRHSTQKGLSNSSCETVQEWDVAVYPASAKDASTLERDLGNKGTHLGSQGMDPQAYIRNACAWDMDEQK